MGVEHRMVAQSRIILNISGDIFETWEDTLSRFPDTLLGQEGTRIYYYNKATNQLFFDRNRLCFGAILFFYQSNGVLNAPPGVPIHVFESECRFFELPVEVINAMRRKEGIILFEDETKEKVTLSLQEVVWNILQNPETSQKAYFFGMFSLSLTWLSVITASIETLHIKKDDSRIFRNDLLGISEIVLNLWFLIELLLRFLFSIEKFVFIKETLNLIDFFAVVPYFILMALDTGKTGLLGIFKTLRFVRVIKLFRLSKHSRRLKVVGIIIKSSLGNFRLLMLCLVIIILLGGNFIFVVESSSPNTVFTSIPESLWWATQTITSVGYGDIIPQTIIGRTFACCFMLFGAVTISLPVLTIVSQFTTLYPKNVEYESYTDD